MPRLLKSLCYNPQVWLGSFPKSICPNICHTLFFGGFMNEKQREMINRKMDAMLLKPRRKTNWGKGFQIYPKQFMERLIELFPYLNNYKTFTD